MIPTGEQSIFHFNILELYLAIHPAAHQSTVAIHFNPGARDWRRPIVAIALVTSSNA